MKTTIHGHVRILERTSLKEEEVFKILESDACIFLGKTEPFDEFPDQNYYLFQSPKRGEGSRIAVTDKDNERLISVYYADYYLPKGVDRPTKWLKYQAQRKLVRAYFPDEDSSKPPLMYNNFPLLEEDWINGTLEPYFMPRSVYVEARGSGGVILREELVTNEFVEGGEIGRYKRLLDKSWRSLLSLVRKSRPGIEYYVVVRDRHIFIREYLVEDKDVQDLHESASFRR